MSCGELSCFIRTNYTLLLLRLCTFIRSKMLCKKITIYLNLLTITYIRWRQKLLGIDWMFSRIDWTKFKTNARKLPCNAVLFCSLKYEDWLWCHKSFRSLLEQLYLILRSIDGWIQKAAFDTPFVLKHKKTCLTPKGFNGLKKWMILNQNKKPEEE